MNQSYFPISDISLISKLCQDEVGKRQYYRPIYSIHKWWARRPGSLFRAILLYSLNQSNQLFDFENGALNISKSLYFNPGNLKKDDLIILDPFMGGGTTVVEANRLGIKTIGSDINPLSFIIVQESLKKLDLNTLEKYFKLLNETVGEEIQGMYKTKCTKCGTISDSLYVFWVRVIECIKCGASVSLFKHQFLNYGEKRYQKPSLNNPATCICPSCDNITHVISDSETECEHCNKKYKPNSNIYNKGSYTCDNCGVKTSLIKSINEYNKELTTKIIAIEYYCETCQKKKYKTPDKDDLSLYNKIDKELVKKKNELLIPDDSIPKGDSSARLISHKFKYFYQLFNSRQLLSFNKIIKGIKDIVKEPEYQDSFYVILSNSLEYNNMMTPYNYPHRKLHHLFNYHALPVTTMPVENCVWGFSESGAGHFINCYKRYINGKKYGNHPYEKIKNGINNEIKTINMELENVDCNFVSTFHKLTTNDRGIILNCGDSSKLEFIPDESIDYVITDPPYLDNIHYSELSNFFTVWLRRLYSKFCNGELSIEFEREAIANKKMGKDCNDYQRILSDVFTECNRVLKNEGILIFTFHHKKIEAWYYIAKSLINSGFYINDYFPARTEYKVNPHIRNKKAKDTDLVLFCNKLKDHDIKEASDIICENLISRKNVISSLKNLCDSETITRGELLRVMTKNTKRSNFSLDYFVTIHDDVLEIIIKEILEDSKMNTIENVIGLEKTQSLITSFK